MSKFINTRRPFRKRRPYFSVPSNASMSVTMVANLGSYTLTGINTNFGITESEQAATSYVITGTSTGFGIKAGLAAVAFTETGTATYFGVGAMVSAGAFTITGLSNNNGIKFGLNVTAFTLTGIDVNLVTVSRKRNFGYIFR